MPVQRSDASTGEYVLYLTRLKRMADLDILSGALRDESAFACPSDSHHSDIDIIHAIYMVSVGALNIEKETLTPPVLCCLGSPFAATRAGDASLRPT